MGRDWFSETNDGGKIKVALHMLILTKKSFNPLYEKVDSIIINGHLKNYESIFKKIQSKLQSDRINNLNASSFEKEILVYFRITLYIIHEMP